MMLSLCALVATLLASFLFPPPAKTQDDGQKAPDKAAVLTDAAGVSTTRPDRPMSEQALISALEKIRVELEANPGEHATQIRALDQVLADAMDRQFIERRHSHNTSSQN
jgi:hypothetical protein